MRVPPLLFILPLLLFSAATAWEAGKTFHVSPAGNDSWSGKLSAPNSGGSNAPG